MLRLWLAFCVFLAPLAVSAQQERGGAVPAIEMQEAPDGHYSVAVLQGLNKVTARISQLEVPVGTSARFGNLELVVRRCWKSAPNERPENAALLEIIDRKPNETPIEAFNGWMFSSSPSLAGLEHPVYDIVVLECQQRELGDES